MNVRDENAAFPARFVWWNLRWPEERVEIECGEPAVVDSSAPYAPGRAQLTWQHSWATRYETL